MFRAGDCGNDAMMNRVRTLDLRLFVGEGAVHSDMLTWNNCEKAESAALQLASVMYSVPQISVRPENMTEELRRMLYDWLWFWERNSDVILNGRLWVESPECLYSAAGVEKDNFYIATKYSPSAVLPAPEGMPDHIILVNGSARHGVALEMPKGRGHFIGTVWDCMGVERDRHGATCNEVAFFNVPPGGRIELHRA